MQNQESIIFFQSIEYNLQLSAAPDVILISKKNIIAMGCIQSILNIAYNSLTWPFQQTDSLILKPGYERFSPIGGRVKGDYQFISLIKLLNNGSYLRFNEFFPVTGCHHDRNTPIHSRVPLDISAEQPDVVCA